MSRKHPQATQGDRASSVSRLGDMLHSDNAGRRLAALSFART